MTIKDALRDYISNGQFFLPDYENDNDILVDFKLNNPILNQEQTKELVLILTDIKLDLQSKYFVADLLYYYDKFGQDLIAPMLQTAIDIKDSSLNRIFLRPCLHSFDVNIIVEWLIDKFDTSNFKEKIGVSRLIYWLVQDGVDTSKLVDSLTKAAINTNNLIELYYYKLALPKNNKLFVNVPDSAKELCNRINGNKEYEYLLYHELGWTKI